MNKGWKNVFGLLWPTVVLVVAIVIVVLATGDFLRVSVRQEVNASFIEERRTLDDIHGAIYTDDYIDYIDGRLFPRFDYCSGCMEIFDEEKRLYAQVFLPKSDKVPDHYWSFCEECWGRNWVAIANKQ